MLLASGKRLGPYEILAPLGAGGMGEVYRARDTRLGREVAIKILSASYSVDAERVRRFEQEARASSALNHPNIISIHDFGTSDSTIYITMELVEGKTLREMLSLGALPLRKLLDIAVQIADGLAKAHAGGIVHRDLKPGNIMISKDGFAKILDFGLAKLLLPQTEEFSQMPTQQKEITKEGVVLGTVAYMSPEQASGRPVDFRSDQFSFGTILYELATGKHPFYRSTSAETLAAIIKDDPEPVVSLNPKLPAPFRWMIERCLAKDAEDRYASTRDLARDLAGIRDHISEVSAATEALPASKIRRRPRELAAWITAALALLGSLALLFFYFQNKSQPSRVVRLSMLPPENWEFADVNISAISPDGRMLAFVAESEKGQSLWLRPLDSLTAKELSERGFYPFWSPDGRFVAFFTSDKLKKIDISTGASQTICDLEMGSRGATFGGRGGTWSRKGFILFGAALGPIYRVPDAGGVPVAVTQLNKTRGDGTHRWPFLLPDGHHFLYEVRNLDNGTGGIYLGSVDSKEERLILPVVSNAGYASGYLFYSREGGLVAQSFDVKKLKLNGAPITVSDQVQYLLIRGTANFCVSENGVLAYTSAPFGSSSQLLWFDRSGNRVGQIGTIGGYYNPRISHDGHRLAISIASPKSGAGDVWIYDLARNLATRMTFHEQYEGNPIWSPDDSSILFGRVSKVMEIYQQTVTSTQQPQRLYFSEEGIVPSDYSTDGRFILCVGNTLKTKSDIWIYSIQTRKMTALIQTEFSESQGQFSPDNRWVAYTSDESGRPEVYVQGFQGATGRWQISSAGGSAPKWKRDGKELFFLAADGKLMATEVKSGSTIEAGDPKALFQTPAKTAEYDVTPDGLRFLMNVPVERRAAPITILLNWPSAFAP